MRREGWFPEPKAPFFKRLLKLKNNFIVKYT
jgi:hypothetical protein